MNFKEFRSSLSESKKMKIKGVTIEVKKVGPKYRAIVDGDKLDDYITKLDEKVISDIKKVQNFWSKYSNSFLNKVQNYIYDLYLKSNNQEAGIMTYGEVSIYIIHYYLKL